MLQVSVAVLGAALVLFGLSRSLPFSLVCMALAGFGMVQAASASNTVIQSLAPDTKRARVMSYYSMAFFGAAPFGSLFAGLLSHRIGAPATLVATGTCCLAGALWFTFELPKIDSIIDPIYREKQLHSAASAAETPRACAVASTRFQGESCR